MTAALLTLAALVALASLALYLARVVTEIAEADLEDRQNEDAPQQAERPFVEGR